jgi:hypothetical protein
MARVCSSGGVDVGRLQHHGRDRQRACSTGGALLELPWRAFAAPAARTLADCNTMAALDSELAAPAGYFCSSHGVHLQLRRHSFEAPAAQRQHPPREAPPSSKRRQHCRPPQVAASAAARSIGSTDCSAATHHWYLRRHPLVASPPTALVATVVCEHHRKVKMGSSGQRFGAEKRRRHGGERGTVARWRDGGGGAGRSIALGRRGARWREYTRKRWGICVDRRR